MILHRRATRGRNATVALTLVAIAGGGLARATAENERTVHSQWIEPGADIVLPAHANYQNALGGLGVINVAGDVHTSGHPFFEPIGTNGRACVTCHQPSDAMSLSLDSIRERWAATQGADPLFDTFDGANCPDQPRGERSSHSLLLDHGLFRIPLAWPPKRFDGTPVKPEFTIEVIKDPTGCNTHPTYGLQSKNPTISVYRRPRMAANLPYILRPGNPFSFKIGAKDIDPRTGRHASMNLMADGRLLSLEDQALDAMANHMQMHSAPDAVTLQRIVSYENQLYVAQQYDKRARKLGGEGAPYSLGPEAMIEYVDKYDYYLGDALDMPVFGGFEAWKSEPADGDEQQRARASIARGHDVFFLRPFWIRDATHINSVGLGNPIRRTCSTCHNAIMTGHDIAPAFMDVGTSNLPWAEARPELPLFKLECEPEAVPHPYLGRTVYTHDPGRALIRTTRSANAIASVRSCVINTTVDRAVSQIDRRRFWSVMRVCASSGPNGSSIRITDGS